MSKRPSRNNYVKFERLNKLADDLEKMVTARPIDFGELVGKEVEEEESSKEFQDTLARIITTIDELKENAYKEETDFILAPLLEKAGGDSSVLKELIANIVNSKPANNHNNHNNHSQKLPEDSPKPPQETVKPSQDMKPNGSL